MSTTSISSLYKGRKLYNCQLEGAELKSLSGQPYPCPTSPTTKCLLTLAPLENVSTLAAARAPVGYGWDNTQEISSRARLGKGILQQALQVQVGALLAGQPSQ